MSWLLLDLLLRLVHYSSAQPIQLLSACLSACMFLPRCTWYESVLLQRVNGRLAMLAFVAVAFGELTTGKSVLEQVPSVPFRIIFVSLMISVASIVPKYSSGNSLADLTEAASKTGLPPVLRFFNKTHEVWLGRVAMLGFTGLIIVELIKGGALFKF